MRSGWSNKNVFRACQRCMIWERWKILGPEKLYMKSWYCSKYLWIIVIFCIIFYGWKCFNSRKPYVTLRCKKWDLKAYSQVLSLRSTKSLSTKNLKYHMATRLRIYNCEVIKLPERWRRYPISFFDNISRKIIFS